mgnify:CR=1 FL=1
MGAGSAASGKSVGVTLAATLVGVTLAAALAATLAAAEMAVGGGGGDHEPLKRTLEHSCWFK